jgi:type I restriction enzyme S subunit
MSEWKKVKLGDYIDVLSGFAFKSKDFSDSGIPVIKIKNVCPPYISLENLSYVPNSIAFQNPRYILRKGDVLIAMTGSHINQIASVVGRVGRVRYDAITVLNQRVGKIVNKNEAKSSLDYIYYYLSQYEVKVELAQKAGGAANQANISPSDIKNLLFPYPPIEIQHRIATILSRYDSLIENYQKQIKLLEEAAQRLYKEWFVDLHFPGHENTKIVDGVPEGWEKKKVGDMISKTQRTKQVTANNYRTSGIIPIIDQSRNYIAGYTDDAECLVKVTVPYIVFGDHTRILKYIPFSFARGADGTQLIMSNDLDRMPQTLFYNSLIGIDLSNYSYARHFKYLKEEFVLLPSEHIARKYDSIVAKYYQSIQRSRELIRLLTEARDRLLPKLMSGEIEI